MRLAITRLLPLRGANFCQFDSHLTLSGTVGAVADLRTSIVALFGVSETAGSDWQELLPGVAGLAAVTTHHARPAQGWSAKPRLSDRGIVDVQPVGNSRSR